MHVYKSEYSKYIVTQIGMGQLLTYSLSCKVLDNTLMGPSSKWTYLLGCGDGASVLCRVSREKTLTVLAVRRAAAGDAGGVALSTWSPLLNKQTIRSDL